MDEGLPQAPLQPNNFRIYAILGVIVVIVLAAYLYIRVSTIEHNPLKNYFAPVYLTPQNDGTIAWYDYTNGNLVQHAAPAPGSVTGLARVNSDMYFSVVPYTRNGATVYRYSYSGGTYTSVYQNKTDVINQLSVSGDGLFLAFVVSSTTPKATVVEVASGKTTPLATSTLLPQFLSVNGTTAVLYSSGTDLVVRVFSNGEWQPPNVVYKGTGATMSLFASNRGKLFAYVDPIDGRVHEMQVSTMVPFAAIEKTTYPALVGFSIGYGGGELFGYHYAFKEDKGQYLHLTVTDAFGGSGKTYSYAAPAALDSTTAIFLLAITSSP